LDLLLYFETVTIMREREREWSYSVLTYIPLLNNLEEVFVEGKNVILLVETSDCDKHKTLKLRGLGQSQRESYEDIRELNHINIINK